MLIRLSAITPRPTQGFMPAARCSGTGSVRDVFGRLMRPSQLVRHFWALQNQRLLCSRLRSALFVLRLGIATRLTPRACAAVSHSGAISALDWVHSKRRLFLPMARSLREDRCSCRLAGFVSRESLLCQFAVARCCSAQISASAFTVHGHNNNVSDLQGKGVPVALAKPDTDRIQIKSVMHIVKNTKNPRPPISMPR